jgi:hypothetical protein
MKSLKVFSALALLAIVVTLNSCKTEEKASYSTSPTLNTMSMLVGKQWKLTEEFTLENGQSVNTLKEYGTCEKDDTYTFMADGNFLLNDNSTKCSGDQKAAAGRWAFNNGDAQHIDVASVYRFTAEIVEVNPSTLKWKFKNPVGEGFVSQTFVKQ